MHWSRAFEDPSFPTRTLPFAVDCKPTRAVSALPPRSGHSSERPLRANVDTRYVGRLLSFELVVDHPEAQCALGGLQR